MFEITYWNTYWRPASVSKPKKKFTFLCFCFLNWFLGALGAHEIAEPGKIYLFRSMVNATLMCGKFKAPSRCYCLKWTSIPDIIRIRRASPGHTCTHILKQCTCIFSVSIYRRRVSKPFFCIRLSFRMQFHNKLWSVWVSIDLAFVHEFMIVIPVSWTQTDSNVQDQYSSASWFFARIENATYTDLFTRQESGILNLLSHKYNLLSNVSSVKWNID